MYNRIEKGVEYQYKQQNPEYMGQPLDRDLANGPRQNRTIRDCLFLILYLAFWVSLIVVAGVAFKNGHPHLLAAPFDSSGKQCGYAPGYENFAYGYYVPNNHSKFVCISHCPSSDDRSQSIDCIYNDHVYKNCSGIAPLIKTIKVVSFCYPQNAKIEEYTDLGLGFFQKSISDLSNTWPISLSIIFMALIVSIGFLAFVKRCGGCLIWVTIILYFIALVTFGVVCFLAADDKIDINGFDELKDPQLLKTISYVALGLAGISFLILLCSISKIRIAATIIRTTAQFTKNECQTIIVPMVMFVAIVILFIYQSLLDHLLLSMADSLYFYLQFGLCEQLQEQPLCLHRLGCWSQEKFRLILLRTLLVRCFLINLSVYRNCEVAIATCQFVIASTCAYWYFSHLRGVSESSSPICRSFCRAIFYHLGSIALGALVLTILWMIQITLQVLHYTTKNRSVSSDPVTNVCFKCCLQYLRCCIACFERFIRFISRNAFIMMAITGDGFCSSAHQGFYLVMRSSREYAITHGVGYLIMFFGKLFISIVCTICGYLMVTHIEYFSEQIYSPFMPTLIFFIISYVISSLFMDVFGVGSDTILLCYSIQMDVMRGLSYACPESLKHIMQQYKR